MKSSFAFAALVAAALLFGSAPVSPAAAAWRLCVVKVCGDTERCRLYRPGTRRLANEYQRGRLLCHKVQTCRNRLVDCPS